VVCNILGGTVHHREALLGFVPGQQQQALDLTGLPIEACLPAEVVSGLIAADSTVGTCLCDVFTLLIAMREKFTVFLFMHSALIVVSHCCVLYIFSFWDTVQTCIRLIGYQTN
jgi:hypothetical protein